MSNKTHKLYNYSFEMGAEYIGDEKHRKGAEQVLAIYLRKANAHAEDSRREYAEMLNACHKHADICNIIRAKRDAEMNKIFGEKIQIYPVLVDYDLHGNSYSSFSLRGYEIIVDGQFRMRHHYW